MTTKKPKSPTPTVEFQDEMARSFISSHLSMQDWYNQKVAEGVFTQHLNTVRKWISNYKERGGPATLSPNNTTTPNSPKAIKEQIERLQQQYKESLSNRVRELEEKLVSIQEELEQAKKELADSQQEEEM